MANIINGGKHADNKIDFQEFMVMPLGAKRFSEGIRMVAEVFHTLKGVLKKAGHNTAVGDEGGFAPNIDNEEAIKFIMDAIDKAGYKRRPRQGLRHRPRLRLSELFDEGEQEGLQVLEVEPRTSSSRPSDMVELFAGWVAKYPIISIEDPLDQDDWAGYPSHHQAPGRQAAGRGRRLLRHQPQAPGQGHRQGRCNSILIKVNQIGTLTETLDAVEMAKRAGYTAVISHRSGETEDATIADIAVATNCGQIKTGSASAAPTAIAKYNQLLRIEEELGTDAVYGSAIWRGAERPSGTFFGRVGQPTGTAQTHHRIGGLRSRTTLTHPTSTEGLGFAGEPQPPTRTAAPSRPHDEGGRRSFGRGGDRFEQVRDDLVGVDPFGLGVEGGDDPVSEDGLGDVADVGDRRGEPALEHGAGLGGEDQATARPAARRPRRRTS